MSLDPTIQKWAKVLFYTRTTNDGGSEVFDTVQSQG